MTSTPSSIIPHLDSLHVSLLGGYEQRGEPLSRPGLHLRPAGEPSASPTKQGADDGRVPVEGGGVQRAHLVVV